jgi:hypothetical protein
MRVTFATEEGETYTVDVDATMELENVAALLEAEVWISSLCLASLQRVTPYAHVSFRSQGSQLPINRYISMGHS